MTNQPHSTPLLYYATNRKGSKHEPLSPGEIRAKGFAGRQKYFGPFRDDKLNCGQITPGSKSQFELLKLDSLDLLPIDLNTKVVVFIHGFNSKFSQASEVLRYLAIETERLNSTTNTLFLLYSWPSMGSPFAYMQDECSVQFSYPLFKQLMETLRKRVETESCISIIAHSLGCQLVYRYLQELEQNVTFGTLILSCPDIDYQTASMETERNKLSRSISQGFILVSDVDKPLELSRALHGYTRLGRPSLSSARSLFWGTFRTGSIPNIVSTVAHAPELLARSAVRRVRAGFKNPDKAWQKANFERAIDFASNIVLYDFTIADRKVQLNGHSACIPLLASLLGTGRIPQNWTEEEIVKIPDEFVECSIFPYARLKPYNVDEQPVFKYKKLHSR